MILLHVIADAFLHDFRFLLNFYSLSSLVTDRYFRMFEATQDGLGRNAPVYSIHGSLLAVGELLRWVWFLICTFIWVHVFWLLWWFMVLNLSLVRLQNDLVYSGAVLAEHNGAGSSTSCKYIQYLTFGGLCLIALGSFLYILSFKKKLLLFLKF